MPKPALAAVLCLALTLGLSPVAPAVAEEPPRWTLREAVVRALRENEVAGVAGARLDQARANRERARAAFLPDLTLTGSLTRRDDSSRRDGTGDEVITRADEVRRGQAGALLTLFDARALPLYAATGRNLAAQRYESAELRRGLAFDVAAAYYAILSADLAREAAERRLVVSGRTVEEARIRREAGLASVNDVTRSELEQASARLALTRAEGDVTAGRLRLARYIASPVEAPLEAPPADSIAAAALPDLEGVALTTRDDLKAARARAAARDRLAREPLLGLVPSLSLRGDLSTTRLSTSDQSEDDWSVALELSWPLYDGGDRYGLDHLRRAEAREAHYATEARRNDIRLEIATGLNDLTTARSSLEQARVAARVAEQNALEVRERFANGLATALEQADATASEFEARVEWARQQLAVDLAGLALTRALGRWPRGLEDLAREETR